MSKHTHEYKNDEAMKCGRETRYDLHSKSGGLFTRESRNFRGREGEAVYVRCEAWGYF